MFATLSQIVGLLSLLAAGALEGPSGFLAALGVVAVYVGLAAERR